jgi:hypothetical protein
VWMNVLFDFYQGVELQQEEVSGEFGLEVLW